AHRQVDVVADDQHRGRIRWRRSGPLEQRLTAQVHERMRREQRDLASPRRRSPRPVARVARHVRGLRAPAPHQLLDHPEPHAVAGGAGAAGGGGAPPPPPPPPPLFRPPLLPPPRPLPPPPAPPPP